MNIRPPLAEDAIPRALSVAFNQDTTCFSVGLESGFASTLPSPLPNPH